MLFGFIYNNNKYFYIRNQLFNIIGIVDNTGNLILQYNYNAYGNNMTITGNTIIGNINPFRYKGYYYDKESGMYYCNSRYYNPLWCRWLNADSINYLDVTDIKCTNLYQYCGNNPILGYDPNGDINWWKLGTLAVATVSIVAGVAATVCTFGAGSVVGVLAITSAITIAANATEVAILQSKKSAKDGDSFEEIVDDCINAVFDNTIGKISNMTKTKPFTQFVGIFGGMAWEALGSNPIEMLKYAFVRTFSTYQNYGNYINGPASKAGVAFSYGFAALNVGFTIGSCFVPDEYIEEYADFRGYILY